MSALLVGMVITGCNPLKKMKDKASDVRYNVNPPVLELVGNQVEGTISGTYPPKYFNQNVIITLTPQLKAGSNEMDLDPYKLQGESIKENNKVIKWEGGSFSFPIKFPYNPAYQQSELFLSPTAAHKAKSLDFDAIKLGDGIITTCLLVEKNGKATYAPDRFVRTTPEKYEAEIKYLIQQSDVRATETRKPEIVALTDAVRAAAANDRIQFKSTELSAAASPDGPYALNDKLSQSRRQTGMDFFSRTFRSAKADEALKSDLLKVVVTAEDWDGFRRLVEASTIRDKELVLRVLSMHSDSEVRDREIRTLAAVFEDIKVQILPELRRTKLTVNVEIVGLSDEEINAQFDKDPSVLKIEEILYAGKIATDPNRKLRVYEAAAKQYPNDWRTKNNLGVALLNLNRTADAKTALNEAKAVQNNETVKNNLAVVEIRDGKFDEAEELLNSAGSSDDVKYNLGTVKIIQGNYNDALSHFGNQVEVNAALAKLLAKQDDAALSTLNSIKSDDALVFYLKAIVGARKSDNDLLFNNLRQACSKSADLKNNAKKDMEFSKFFNESTFRSIVN